ncbi:hypothetical protein E4T56_gene1136 [Termitomyces sp. T112]|nr:hypothetical protein E4T56_gene1136 [Termitomyces sp. T112]
MLNPATDRGQPLQLWSETPRVKPNNTAVNTPKCNGTLQEDSQHPIKPWDSLPQYSANSPHAPRSINQNCINNDIIQQKGGRQWGAEQQENGVQLLLQPLPSSGNLLPSSPIPKLISIWAHTTAKTSANPGKAEALLHPPPPPTTTLGPPHCTANAPPATSSSSPSPAEALDSNPWTSASTCLGSTLVP